VTASPAERSLLARAAAATRWSREPDRRQATQAARDGRWQRYLDQVDPDGVLPEAERARRAELARQADMLRMSAAAAKSRRRRREKRERGEK
jgi:hypothetical protein